jgi:hypothetical protein
MRTNMPHIFASSDIVGQPMLAQKAVYEAHDTDPEVAWSAWQRRLRMGVVRTCRRCASNAKTDTFCLPNAATMQDATNYAMSEQ